MQERGTGAAPKPTVRPLPSALAAMLLGAATLGGQPVRLEDPVRFWTHEAAYSGADSCETCHPQIAARQRASNHARSLRAAQAVPELTADLPLRRHDRVSGLELTLSGDARSGLRLTAGGTAESSEAALGWAFGSGIKGITPVGRTASGQWVESRLTWYRSLGGIDFTTGASKHDPETAAEGLGRSLTEKQVAECFGCHTTGFDSRSSEPQEDETGVRCERCHGPGRQHVEAAAAGRPLEGTIFNPGTLSGFPQTQLCGACHGRPPEDNDFDLLALLERTPHSVRFPSQRITLSRCFNETFGELACTNCHDAHGDVSDEAASFDGKCLACHEAGRRERGAACSVASSDCASCHMPRERVMRHSMFSDHWIRVVQKDGP